MANCRECVIVAYGRSPVGKAPKGKLKLMHPVDLGAQTLAGVLKKVPQLNPADIDNVILGCARTNDTQGRDVARQILVRAGLPLTVHGLTVSSFCSSALNAMIAGASEIMANQADIIVAGGIEMNSRVNNQPGVENPWLLENYPDIYLAVGNQAENICARKGYSRQQNEEIGVMSHTRALAAQAAGKFNDEIIPIEAPTEDGGTVLVTQDEGPRESKLEVLMGLKTPFKADGVVSAGSASQTSDGASILVMMSREKADELGLKPVARFVCGMAGADRCSELSPAVIGTLHKLFDRFNFKPEDFDVIELNEAFAAVVMDVQDEFHFDWAKVNPNGSGISLGHPLGATGGIMACKAISELKRTNGRYALLAMCANMGQAGSVILERL